MKKTVLITGGAKGIGRATAEVFAENDFNVVINYLSSEKAAQSFASELKERGLSVLVLRADITSKVEVEKMFEEAYRTFGTIDILVNNAGISHYSLFPEITEAEWDRMINVHLKGMFNCCKQVVPDMIRKKQGKIVNISSIWGMVGASCEVSYSTAKAGMIGFTKALAKELGPSNIQVNCVAPGVIETDMLNPLSEVDKDLLREEIPLMRFGQVKEIANLVLFLAKQESDYLTGQVISPNGGLVT
ncbi:elongation factor P 5-aminopentanone reductase [Desulfitobacterium metallireducens]|uniref:3-ketoacyl-ACP reductase n=1 Tax=Desulfitobacterium metallireducens DSM 15288 TaxID=871968 RepID=W0EB85_9FIRM|nr:SDR family oxidoreductase [Desulfitobacterium metallireducens]AHF06479.1 3-ketoacyl-ACP reductase [Desulfitobacterium metallireducens DSM 15288]